MDMGSSAINTFYEISGLSTPTTRIQRPTDGSHWITPDHIFGEATELVMCAVKSDHDYNFKTEFQIWKENQDFDHQNILMSRPPLNLTPVGTNTKNAKITFGINSCWYKNSRP